nr:MAG TPA: hypothetical protein [Caudoviricetes sp.]
MRDKLSTDYIIILFSQYSFSSSSGTIPTLLFGYVTQTFSL